MHHKLEQILDYSDVCGPERADFEESRSDTVFNLEAEGIS